MKGQIVGPLEFGGMNLKMDDLEWKLHKLGAVQSNLNRKDDEKKVRGVEEEMIKTIRESLVKQQESDGDSD